MLDDAAPGCSLSSPKTAVGFIAGAFSCVRTLRTPGAVAAARVSICLIFPLAMRLKTSAPCVTSSPLYSAANVALPVVFKRPSTRLNGWPMAPGFTTLGLILHLLHSQRCQHAQNRAPGEIDLECIVLVATCHF